MRLTVLAGIFARLSAVVIVPNPQQSVFSVARYIPPLERQPGLLTAVL